MAALSPGFADPVHDAQAAFRAVMRAMARPGRIETLTPLLDPPRGLPVAAAAAGLAVMDFETSLWLSPSLAADPATGAWLRFHAGAPAATQSGAAFAIVDLRRDGLDLSAFAQGTAEYPDRSATIVLLCETLEGEGPLSLAGPGVKDSVRFGFGPVPADFLEQWAQNRARFPLGVDLILVAGTRIACLPRGTRILREAA